MLFAASFLLLVLLLFLVYLFVSKMFYGDGDVGGDGDVEVMMGG